MAIEVGQRVIWHREGREPALGVAVRVTDGRIQIRTSRVDGEVILPWVEPDHLEVLDRSGSLATSQDSDGYTSVER